MSTSRLGRALKRWTYVGLPVELDESALAVLVNEDERVDTESLHHAVRARNSVIRKGPGSHVQGLGSERHEVPERVVRGLRLGKADVGLGLAGVDEVDELDAVLDEEDGDVVCVMGSESGEWEGGEVRLAVQARVA